MKPIFCFCVLLAAAANARADWKDLKPGMDQATAAQCVGAPLLQNRGRVAVETWTYDRCGYIQFAAGRVVYWEPSKPDPKTSPAAATAKSIATADKAKRKPARDAVAFRD